MSDLIKALKIFLKYVDPYNPTNCSHDELSIMDIDREKVSEADIKELAELSFHWNEEYDYFYSYRFGSA